MITGRNAGRRLIFWSKITNLLPFGTSKQAKLTSLKLNFLLVNLCISTFSKFNLSFDFNPIR